jgi:hypothetical protein
MTIKKPKTLSSYREEQHLIAKLWSESKETKGQGHSKTRSVDLRFSGDKPRQKESYDGYACTAKYPLLVVLQLAEDRLHSLIVRQER